MTTTIDRAYLERLRQLGHIEGVSTLVLLGIAMPLKYVADMPLAVRIAGSLHGFLFLALLAALFVAIKRVPIGSKLALFGAIGAVVPFGPFVVDRWLRRVGEVTNAPVARAPQSQRPGS